MKKIIILLLLTKISVGQMQDSLRLNEIMFKTSNKNSEFIEIVNVSAKDTVDLTGISIQYYSSKKDKIVFPFLKSKLPPKAYCVVLEGDYSFSENIYNLAEDKNLIVCTISDKAFGTSGMSNSSNRELKLFDKNGKLIDSYTYTANNGSDISDERITFSDNSWGNSKFKMGTPGKKNSISPKEYDVEVKTIYLKIFDSTNRIKVGLKVVNNGIEKAEFQVNLIKILGDKSEPQIIDSLQLNLNTLDSIKTEFNNYLLLDGFKCQLEVRNIFAQDEDTLNNSRDTTIYCGYFKNAVQINEVMFNPENNEPEWFELKNVSADSVCLARWKFSDLLPKRDLFPLFKEEIKLAPDSFLVFAKDSSIIYHHQKIPSRIMIFDFGVLNNNYDGLIIKDYWGRTIDSLFYRNRNFKKGFSIERLNSSLATCDTSNWKQSENIEQSTPGFVNSIEKYNYDVAIDTAYVLSNKKGEASIFFSIKNVGFRLMKNVEVRVLKNDLLLYVYNITRLAAGESFNKTLGNILVFGNEKFRVEINSEKDYLKKNNLWEYVFEKKYKKGVVRISEIFFNSKDKKSFAIEVYNNSDVTINMRGWEIISENNFKTIKIEKDLFLSSHKYVTLISNNFDIQKFNIKDNYSKQDFLFSNSKDELILVSPLGNEIDDICFDDKIYCPQDFSIEIKLVGNVFIHHSLSNSGNTFGRKNSIDEIINKKNNVVINEILFESSEAKSSFIEIYNNDLTAVNIAGWELQVGDRRFEISSTKNFLNSGEYFLLINDKFYFSEVQDNLINKNNNYTTCNKFRVSFKNQNIKLSNVFGLKIDSLNFLTDFVNSSLSNATAYSVERINPNWQSNYSGNWGSCNLKEGSTPWKQNSIYFNDKISSRQIEILPNPFYPDKLASAKIKYNFTGEDLQLTLKVFDIKGRLIRNMENGKPIANKGILFFDGKDSNGGRLKRGMYILYFEIIDNFNHKKNVIKKIIVIG